MVDRTMIEDAVRNIPLRRGAPNIVSFNKEILIQKSPLAKMGREESQYIHTGVKIFLQVLSKEKLFGAYLVEDLAHIHALLNSIAQIVKKGDYSVKYSNQLSWLREELDKSRVQLEVKLRRGDRLVTSLGSVLRAYFNDELALMKVIDEKHTGGKSVPLSPNTPQKFSWFWEKNIEKRKRADEQKMLLDSFGSTKAGLMKIIPLYDEMAYKYYDFRGRLSKLLDQSKKGVFKTGDVDFTLVIAEFMEAEKRLASVLGPAEAMAQQRENLSKFGVYNNYRFISLVKNLAAGESQIIR
ncbi:hypothetical protein HYU21_00760 [Candidatus Woesearchaeota archaeon]|nr:hypothetical protein [Candidatus Woesearchaeota archaeon]